jgi:hypothetical protein
VRSSPGDESRTNSSKSLPSTSMRTPVTTPSRTRGLHGRRGLTSSWNQVNGVSIGLSDRAGGDLLRWQPRTLVAFSRNRNCCPRHGAPGSVPGGSGSANQVEGPAHTAGACESGVAGDRRAGEEFGQRDVAASYGVTWVRSRHIRDPATVEATCVGATGRSVTGQPDTRWTDAGLVGMPCAPRRWADHPDA